MGTSNFIFTIIHVNTKEGTLPMTKPNTLPHGYKLSSAPYYFFKESQISVFFVACDNLERY